MVHKIEVVEQILKLMRENNISRIADGVAGYGYPQVWYVEEINGREYESPVVCKSLASRKNS